MKTTTTPFGICRPDPNLCQVTPTNQPTTNHRQAPALTCLTIKKRKSGVHYSRLPRISRNSIIIIRSKRQGSRPCAVRLSPLLDFSGSVHACTGIFFRFASRCLLLPACLPVRPLAHMPSDVRDGGPQSQTGGLDLFTWRMAMLVMVTRKAKVTDVGILSAGLSLFPTSHFCMAGRASI